MAEKNFAKNWKDQANPEHQMKVIEFKKLNGELFDDKSYALDFEATLKWVGPSNTWYFSTDRRWVLKEFPPGEEPFEDYKHKLDSGSTFKGSGRVRFRDTENGWIPGDSYFQPSDKKALPSLFFDGTKDGIRNEVFE